MTASDLPIPAVARAAWRPRFALEHLLLALAAVTLWVVVLPVEFVLG